MSPIHAAIMARNQQLPNPSEARPTWQMCIEQFSVSIPLPTLRFDAEYDRFWSLGNPEASTVSEAELVALITEGKVEECFGVDHYSVYRISDGIRQILMIVAGMA